MFCEYCKKRDHSKHRNLYSCSMDFCSCMKYVCYPCLIGDHSDYHNLLGFCVRWNVEDTEICGCRLMTNKRDIYQDLCDDNPPEKGLVGYWSNSPTWTGSCNACYYGDNLSHSYGGEVFIFKARSLEMRLCAGHLRELVKQSRYK